jgi:Na+/H+ antiporter NhaD/arsenite permease-like protein
MAGHARDPLRQNTLAGLLVTAAATLLLLIGSTPAHAAIADGPAAPANPGLLGIPVEFFLFGLMLLGVALFHKRALEISVGGLAAILLYEALVTAFPTGTGADALVAHLEHEWVTVTNLLLLLIGFEVLSNHFEHSNLPDHLPRLLPDDWTGGLALLGIVFVMAAFLDNIAAAVLGGVMARHVYQGCVSVGFLAAIVAASNAGGAGSVIGDTTTTLMWLNGVSAVTVLAAYLAAVPAFLIFAPFAARSQHRHQSILANNLPGRPLHWQRIWIVAAILVTAVAANVLASSLSQGVEMAPWLGLALWAAILVTSRFGRPDWSVVRPAAKGAIFLVALVLSASLMPIGGLPTPSWQSAFGLGLLSSVFDNIPLTALALRQGGYDWALLSYAVGFGGSMVWFGSSAGVAITNEFPEGRSVKAWLKEGWFVAVAYAVGFFVMLLVTGWDPGPM